MVDKTEVFQPTWANEPTILQLTKDVEAMSGIQDDIRLDLEEYKMLRAGGKQVKVKPGKSITLPKVIREHQEWKYPALEEPLLNTPRMFQVLPRGSEDSPAAIQNGRLLNYQYDVQLDKVQLVNDIVHPFVDEGTVIVKTGWDVEYKTVKQIVEKPVYADAETSLKIIQQGIAEGKLSQEEAQRMLNAGEPIQVGTKEVEEETEILVKNQPYHEVLDSANVGIDPSCNGDIRKAKFVWYEYDASFAELKKNEYVELEDGTTRGYYRNIEEAIGRTGSEGAYNFNKPVPYMQFAFDDKARRKTKAVEYWGYWDIQGDGVLVGIVAEWINGILVRLEKNPLVHGRLPFSSAQYMPVTRSSRGEPDDVLIADSQESIGKMMRAVQDITSTAATGQEFIDANFFNTPADKNQYEKGNTVYFTPGMDPNRSIKRRTVDNIDKSIFDALQVHTEKVATLTGTRPFGNNSGGLGLNRMALDATAKRELSVLRRLSALFVDMANMVVAMNQAYMEEEQVIRITDSEFVPIKRDELQGNFDLVIGVSTPEKDEQQAQSLLMLLQTNAASMDPELYKIVMGKILRLQYHPDLAEKVEKFKPEPDPKAIEEADLRIENLRLVNEKVKMEMVGMQSVVTERATRGTENLTADIKNKLAQAELRAAQAEAQLALAEKLNSESDKIDQEFLLESKGITRERTMQDKEFDATNKYEELLAKIGDKNAG